MAFIIIIDAATSFLVNLLDPVCGGVRLRMMYNPFKILWIFALVIKFNAHTFENNNSSIKAFFEHLVCRK